MHDRVYGQHQRKHAWDDVSKVHGGVRARLAALQQQRATPATLFTCRFDDNPGPGLRGSWFLHRRSRCFFPVGDDVQCGQSSVGHDPHQKTLAVSVILRPDRFSHARAPIESSIGTYFWKGIRMNSEPAPFTSSIKRVDPAGEITAKRKRGGS